MEFSDISQESLVKGKKKGCVVTPVKGFLLFLLAAAACVCVGVGVYYLHPDKDSGSTTLAPTTTTVAAPPADENVKLPSTLIPVHYNLTLRPDIYSQDPSYFKFSGNVLITFKVQEETKEIFLHERKLNIDDTKVKVTNSAGQVSDGQY